MKQSTVATAIALALSALPSAAQTLYKLIDKNGKVTYADSPPKDFDGKVIPIEIDPNRNRATLVTPGTPEAERAIGEKMKASEAAGAELKQAQARLETARKNLAFARDNPLEGEVERRGTAGGGTRPVFTEDYERRIAALEEAVKTAEDAVQRAQRARSGAPRARLGLVARAARIHRVPGRAFRRRLGPDALQVGRQGRKDPLLGQAAGRLQG